MNKSFSQFALAIALLLPVSVFGQLQIGLKFSPIASFGSVEDSAKNSLGDINKQAMVGLQYGLIFNVAFADHYFFHTGITIVNKGFTYSTPEAANLKYKITSLEIPLGFKLLSGELGKGIFLKGIFAISADFNVGFEHTFYDTDAMEVRTTKNSKFVNTFGATFIFGPGVDIVVGNAGAITMGVIYHQGLTNTNNQNNSGLNATVKVSYFSLDLGYFF